MADTLPGTSFPRSSSPELATEVAQRSPSVQSPNGLYYAQAGDTGLDAAHLERMVQAVPASMAAALASHSWYFVPLALAETPRAAVVACDDADTADGPAAEARAVPGHRGPREDVLIVSAHTPEFAELAICHRNVELPAASNRPVPHLGVFLSTRLLSDRFALAFELFINIAHAFVDHAGVPASFAELAWNQAVADVRGETSLDAWEYRTVAVAGILRPAVSPTALREMRRPSPTALNPPMRSAGPVDDKAKADYLEAGFADAVAIYLLSLALDFDYSELREREYPLLAPRALAERLRLVARLFPPNAGYDFAIRYRRRA